MSRIRIELDVQETQATCDNLLHIGNDANFNSEILGRFIEQRSNTFGVGVRVTTGAVRASHAFTFTGNPVNNETCTINGVTFTAKTSGATGNQFNIGASASATADNFAAAINASATAGISGVVTASSLSGVVTVSAITPGVFGNYLLAPTEGLTNCTVSAWSGGADGNTKSWGDGRALT